MSDDAFRVLLDELQADPRVAGGMMFGHRAAKLASKVFCIDFDGELVVKLGAERVQELAAEGTATVFDPMGGRPMTGWAQVPPGSGDPLEAWLALAEEAKTVVS